ncbi:MAG TPA: hypothetical protein PLC42_07545 [Parachlamydiaceae bacterium]|nr:hypothetical protein [Parachlamydiaceae bacterium]
MDKLNSFSWGDPVTIKQNAPKYYKPGFKGSICGIRIIDSPEVAEQFNAMIGSELYLIEFIDGEALEIPKSFLLLLENQEG